MYLIIYPLSHDLKVSISYHLPLNPLKGTFVPDILLPYIPFRGFLKKNIYKFIIQFESNMIK